jgi:hypothetical protein
MPYFDYDQHDELFNALRDCRRLDRAKHLPSGGTQVTTEAAEFWVDVAARFSRGEWQDAVTAIERRFEPRSAAPWVRDAEWKRMRAVQRAA